jgi:riboflavin synthase alpha subunit
MQKRKLLTGEQKYFLPNSETFDETNVSECQVREKSAHIKVAISALTIRKDGHLIQTKVNQTNNLLNSFCSDNNVDFINHTNIDLDCLNRGGLHLNRKGSTIMQRNYMDFLN